MRALPMPPLPSVSLLPLQLRSRLIDRLEAIRIPAFTVPTALARLLARLPQQPPTEALTLALNLALDRILSRDTLAPLQSRHLRMCVTDAGLTLDFSFDEKGFHRHRGRGRPDLVLSASTRDYLALALREEDPDSLFFDRRLRMEGDTELGLLVKNTLDAVDWDGLKARILATRASG